MKLYLARHGQTNYNVLELCNADPAIDVHLTELGLNQASALANKLKTIQIDHIFISELKRTQQTADIVNKYHNAPIEIEPLLNDHRSGFEGKSAQLLFEAMNSAENKWTARFNNGESVEDMKQRVAIFLKELKDKPYGSALVVTSGWVIYATAAIIQNISNEEAWNIDISQGSYLEMEV
jgi:probable phosphoglycerate mutase